MRSMLVMVHIMMIGGIEIFMVFLSILQKVPRIQQRDLQTLMKPIIRVVISDTNRI